MAYVSNDKVSIPGLGEMPTYFFDSFDGFNLEEYSNSTNHHNENNFYGRCNRDDWFNDVITISGSVSNEGYVFTMCMNSEVSLPLYDDGCVTLSYDASVQKWNDLTATANNWLWRFCTPSEVVDVVTGALDCYNDEPESLNVTSLSKTIQASKDSLAAGVAVYREDAQCNINWYKPVGTIKEVEVPSDYLNF